MYAISLYELSMHNNNYANLVPLNLEFELHTFEDSIQLTDIKLSDQHNRIQNILDIQVIARSHSLKIKKTVGQIQTSLLVFNQYSNITKWNWIFDSNDISIIENVRAGDLGFDIEVNAIIQISDGGVKILAFNGKGQVRFHESEWISFIRHFGYSTKYGMSLPSSLLNDINWLKAYEFLDDAREHMQRGKTHDALGQCLSTLESYMDSAKRGGPYSDKVWDELLEDVVPQKKEGIARLISGVATYLNMIGHHRNSRQKENGNLPRIPIDQYEAEVMLGISQLLVTYLERLKEEYRPL